MLSKVCPNLTIANLLVLLFFVVAGVTIITEYFEFDLSTAFFKPILPAVMMLLYWVTSVKRHRLFFVAMIFSVFTNIWLAGDNSIMLSYALLPMMVIRLIIIFMLVRILAIKDFIPVTLATIPMMVVFFYMFSITHSIPENSYVLVIIQNVLVAILGGIAMANYFEDESKNAMWLAICGLLFVALHFVFLIERFYLSGLTPTIFRPIATFLGATAYYCFYRFLLAGEISSQNHQLDD